jgi:hypothetical protein
MLLLLLAVAAAILAIVGIVRSRGTNEVAWAALCLAAIHLIPEL